MPPIVELEDVSFAAGGATIPDRVSWRISQGEHWALLGPNGAGKTTLLRIACGYLWPNAGGRVLRLGEPLADLRTLRRSIGWVTSLLNSRIPPQEPALDTVVSGKFAQLGLKHLGGEEPSPADYDRARLLLAEIDCQDLVAKPFGVLSQGEQQKVLVTRARMAAPLLVILDEPCAGLDPGARERVLAAIERLAAAKSGPSMVLVTHHLEEIMPSFEQLLVLEAGRVVHAGPKESAIDAVLLGRLYGSRPAEVQERAGRYWPLW